MINTLSLFDFRNYEKRTFEFLNKNIVFFGDNGQGKTNILEAISILSVGKSWRELAGKDLIFQNPKFELEKNQSSNLNNISAVIQAQTSDKNHYKVIIEPKKRSFFKNEKKVSLRQHFGKIPTLLFVPEHLTLFSGSKRDRQRFFDRFLFQTIPNYQENLLRFHRALKQKNALLKILTSGSNSCIMSSSLEEIEPWNKILAETIPALIKMRKEFLTELNPILQKELSSISKTKDSIKIQLVSQEFFEPTYGGVMDFFQKNKARELKSQRCLIGAHRDDFIFSFREKKILTTASRGEERSVLLALLVAKKHLLKSKLGISPILLLDDVFSELDQKRQDYLENLCDESQVFFTTTHESHFENFFQDVQKIQVKSYT